jgi:hypothetical protein
MEWAAIPYADGQFIVCHKGQQVKWCKDYNTAVTFIQKYNKPKRRKKL